MQLNKKHQDKLAQDLQNQINHRGIKVITSIEDFTEDTLKKVTTIVGLSRNDGGHVQRTKAWHPKTTLFYIGRNPFETDLFLESIANVFKDEGRAIEYSRRKQTVKL